MLVAESNRESARRQGGEKEYRGDYPRTETGLAEIEGQLREAIKNSPAQQAKAVILQQVPRVGPQLARCLIAEVPDSDTWAAVRSPR